MKSVVPFGREVWSFFFLLQFMNILVICIDLRQFEYIYNVAWILAAELSVLPIMHILNETEKKKTEVAAVNEWLAFVMYSYTAARCYRLYRFQQVEMQ